MNVETIETWNPHYWRWVLTGPACFVLGYVPTFAVLWVHHGH